MTLGDIFTDEQIEQAFQIICDANFVGSPKLVDRVESEIIQSDGERIHEAHGGKFIDKFLAHALLQGIAHHCRPPAFGGPSYELKQVKSFNPETLLNSAPVADEEE